MTLDRLYRDVENLKKQYRGLAGGPQLALSSIENGAIDSKDADGNLKMTIGLQDDGGNTINVISGPIPPTPVGFTVETDHGKFIVHWSGDFDGDKLAPSDWSRAEVHASQDPFFVPSRATARGSIVSAAGGEVTIGVLKGPWTIKMLAWSQAGKMSAPSAPVTVEVPGYGEILLEEIDAAQTRIENARAILVGGQETLGTKLDEADTALASLRDSLDNLDETTLPALRQDLDAAEGRLSDAESDITDAFGQLDAVPGQISDARQAAIDAAQADAEAKAQAAETAAKAHADLVAEGAEADAVAAAEVRAQELADAAQDAAEAAAALDATQKANAAEAAAKATAQAAQTAADNARSVAESKASVDYILSRGTDLVTNGTGHLNDNTNFSGFVFDPKDAPTGSRGSFDKDGPASTGIRSDESMPVDVSRRYLMRLQARQSNPNVLASIFYAGVVPIDGDGNEIVPAHYTYNPASMVKLTEDLKPGDTKAVVEDGSDWSATGWVNLSAWNYVDDTGKAWKPGTYTRHMNQNSNPTLSGNVITMSRPWPHGAVPAGTYVSAGRNGSNFMYLAATNQVAPQEWATFSGSTLRGAHDGSLGAATRQFPQGTAAARLLFLMSYQNIGVPSGQVSKQSIAAVSFSDATLALEEAESSRAAAATAQAEAEAAHAAAGSASNAAVAAMDRANAVKGEASADATAKANAAKAAAEAASKAYSDNMPKVLHGTTVATGTAPDGSIWWQHQGALSGPVVGQWNRVDGSWVSTPIRSEAIANLDVGKLTAGAAELATVVSQKIAAAVGQFLELDVGQLTVTGASKLASVVAEQIAADVGEYVELSVGQLVAGEGVMDEATVQKLFTDVVVAGIAQAQEFIGENAILTGAVTAPKITASEELTAKIAEFLRVRAEHIESDAIDGMVVRGLTLIAGNDRHRLDDSGYALFDDDGDRRTFLSPEGSTFKGEVEAETFVANGGAELRGTNNTLAQGAKLTLAAGVTDPTAPPVVQPYWEGVELDSPVDGAVGLAFDGTNYWTGTKTYSSGGGYRASMVRISPTGAVVETRTANLWNEFWGVTCIGSELFWLYKEFGAYSWD